MKGTLTKRNILRNIIILVICLFITYILFFKFASDFLTRFIAPSMILSLGFMIFTAATLYILCISVVDRKVNRINIDILAVLYFGITILLSFFKTISNFTGINLNPFSIINDFRGYFNFTVLLVVTNTLIYLPLGAFVKSKIKISNFKLLLGFLLYILLIETMQYMFHRGIFDINDIILNTIGFYMGALCTDFIIKKGDKFFGRNKLRM